jgi:hypothetical protein
MNHEFPADGPQKVYVELQSGELTVTAAPTDRVTVEVSGDGAEHVAVRHRGEDVHVVAPRRTGFFSSSPHLAVHVTAPEGSHLATRLGSARVTTTGLLGTVRIATGSGDVTVAEVEQQAVVKTGSGDIRVQRLGGESELKAGSGDISVGRADGSAHVATGSGSVRVGQAIGVGQPQEWIGRPRGRRPRSGRGPVHRLRRPPRGPGAQGPAPADERLRWTSTSASPPAPPCGPTSPAAPVASTPPSRPPGHPPRARTTSRCGPAP